jgi:hypothetical protein
MQIINTPFQLSVEVLDTISHFLEEKDSVDKDLVFKSIGKTKAYLNKSLNFLIQLGVLEIEGNQLKISSLYKVPDEKDSFYSGSIIKKALTVFEPFKEYCSLIQTGKKENTVLKLIKAKYGLKNELSSLKSTFDIWLRFLEKDIIIVKEEFTKVSSIPNKNNFLHFDENGHLHYNHEEHSKRLLEELDSKRFVNPLFVDLNRIEALKGKQSTEFDLNKLIRICEEINDAFRFGNYFTVGILTRVIIDHVPPVFRKASFTEVANSHGTRSFKDTMRNLDTITRKISDGLLHTHIRKKEDLPNATTVDCKNGIDVLLGEIINLL